MPASPTFVLGLGCQKGGTTWLSQYLADSPQFEPGFKKEYHVFDHPDFQDKAQQKAIARASKMLNRMEEGKSAQSGPLLWASFFADRETYYDHFSGLLTRPGIRATGDITPLYSRLPGERLTEIRGKFADRGIRTVAVLLMRDPVERVWSHARMYRRGMDDSAPGSAERMVAARYAKPVYSERTRYDRTLAAMDEAFPPEDIYVEFYERLFSERPLRRLAEQIGIDFHAPDLDYRANATKKTTTLAPDITRTVANHFRPVYEAVAARFPDVDLPALWPSMKLLDEPVESAAWR